MFIHILEMSKLLLNFIAERVEVTVVECACVIELEGLKVCVNSSPCFGSTRPFPFALIACVGTA